MQRQKKKKKAQEPPILYPYFWMPSYTDDYNYEGGDVLENFTQKLVEKIKKRSNPNYKPKC